MSRTSVGSVIVDPAAGAAESALIGQQTAAKSLPVVLASDQGSVPQTTATVGAPAQKASSATSITLLALNTARKGFSVFNDSTQPLYVKFGTTASATDYNVKVAAQGFYESPASPVYTGRVDGIWAAANGNGYVAELT